MSILEGEQWGPPTLLAKSNLDIGWRWRRTVHSSAEHGTFLMLIKEEHVSERHVLFGSVEGPLGVVPLDTLLTPYAGTFLLEGMKVLAAIQVGPSSGDPNIPATFYLMQSADLGRNWSKGAAVPINSGVAALLQLQRDGSDALHVTWFDNGLTMRHAWQRRTGDPWAEMPLPAAPAGKQLLTGASLVSNRGTPFVIRQAVDEAGTGRLMAACFKQGRWSSWQQLPFEGGFPLLGFTEEGRSVAAFTGARDGVPNAALELWLVHP